MYAALATGVVLLHFAFIVFVVGGGLLALKWPNVAWVHVPCAAWGAWVELAGKVCPLTPLENRLRRLAGESGYAGGFIDQYIMPVMYPPGLTREMQVALGVSALLLNLGVYAWVLRRTRSAGRSGADD
jgi:hypothetical protein